jgi:TrmH family RNA methyltransferase
MGNFFKPLQLPKNNIDNTRTSNFGTPLHFTQLMISKSLIKLVQSLKLKKFRQKYKLFVVEGDKQINTILLSPELVVRDLIATEAWIDKNNQWLTSNISVHFADANTLKAMSAFSTGSEVMAIAELIEGQLDDLKSARRIIYLDDVQDPGNVGTIIRLADWYGIDAVIRSSNSADFYNPKTVQSTMGSIAAVKLINLPDEADIVQLCQGQLIVSSLEGADMPQSLVMDKFCLVIGNESRGVNPHLIKNAHHLIKIKGSSTSKADSLNAAVSTAILLDRLIKI